MTSTNNTLANALVIFSQNFIKQHIEQSGHLPIIEHDEQWRSPCDAGIHEENRHFWQPVEIRQVEDELSFVNVESALSIELHPDIKTYYTTLYSEDIDAECSEGQLSLLFAWNSDDFDRLQENIIGHILMKQRLKQDETIFFAVTDEEDMIISIDNSNGQVWAERVGCKPHKKLSDSLEQFINELSPVPVII